MGFPGQAKNADHGKGLGWLGSLGYTIDRMSLSSTDRATAKLDGNGKMLHSAAVKHIRRESF